MRMKMRTRISLLLCLAFLCGCAGPALRPAVVSTQPVPKEPPPFENGRYVLQPGDEIEIKFYYQPDLSEAQSVRPDGKITLQLIGDVQAAGETAEELSKAITTKYHKILRRPEATVIVKRAMRLRAFIGGRVEKPGLVELDGPLTVLQAIIQSGGFSNSAEMRNVLLIRRKTNYSKPVVYSLNLEEPQNDLLLRPYDIVYVSPNVISQVDAFVKDYITSIIPWTFSISYYLNQYGP